MLIMPSTDVNFQALAENITSDFFTNNVPLSDGIVKTAKEHSFTPEEVRRLVEHTNTAASLHLLKTAADKKGTFTLAQVDLVLQETHPAASEEEKTASVYTGLPHTRKAVATHAEMEKAASESLQKTAQKPQIGAMQAMFTVRKALDEKKLEKTALAFKVQDKLDYLASEFSRWQGPDFNKFATDCRHAFGEKSVPVLEGLAKYLRVPLEKTAANVDFVDDRTPQIQAMQEVCTGLEGLLKLGSEITELEDVLGKIWGGMKGLGARSVTKLAARTSEIRSDDAPARLESHRHSTPDMYWFGPVSC